MSMPAALGWLSVIACRGLPVLMILLCLRMIEMYSIIVTEWGAASGTSSGSVS